MLTHSILIFLGLVLCCAFLLLGGANPNVRNREGKTAADIARERAKICTLKVLETDPQTIEEARRCMERPVPPPSLDVGTRTSMLNFILSSEANFHRTDDYQGTFVWDGVQEVLARIWHGITTIRDIFGRSRQHVPSKSAQ